MKKHLNLLILLGLCMIVKSTYSQKLYFNFGVGNNYIASTNFQMTDNTDIYSTTGTATQVTGIKRSISENVSFGKGFQYGGTIGYMPSKSVCLELNINYIKSSIFEDKYCEKFSSFDNVFSQKYQAQMLRFSPSLRFTLENEIICPYMKTGLVIGVGTKIHVEEYFDFRGQNNTEVAQESEFEMSGGISVGFAAGIGINIKTDKCYGFFSEINFISQTWAPEKLSYTKFYQNSMNVMAYVPVNIKESVFVDSFSNNVPNSNTDSPSEKLKVYYPFSSIGWNIGIYFKL